MTSTTRYTRHKLASFVLVLVLALSFAIPAYAEEVVDAEAASAAEQQEAMVEANQGETGELEAAHNTGCMPTLTIDQPSGNVTGAGFISGWFADLNETFSIGGGPIDLYRGDTWVMSTSTGASRDVGHVRPDVDAALGITDGRTGWFFRMDWSTQPGGNQTYRVLGKTHCEWTERTFSVNVNPAPPAPAASLSIEDVSRTMGSSATSGLAQTQTCIQYNALNQCTQYGSTNTGIYGGSSTCISRDVYGNCISYGSNVYGSNYGGDLNFDFSVTLNPASTQTVQVDYATQDGSAVQGTDYNQTNGTLTFAPGETSKTITVRVHSRGNIYNQSRDFLVNLSNPRGASISDGQGRGTIRSYSSSTSGNCLQYDVNGACISYGGGSYYGGIGNCAGYGIGYTWNGIQCVYTGGGVAGSGSINISDATCGEGTSCTFTVTQTGGVGTATVTFTTVNGTATAGTCGAGGDYTAQSSSVLVTAGGSGFISIFACTDALVDPGETFTVTLTGTNSGTIVDGTGIGTITGP